MAFLKPTPAQKIPVPYIDGAFYVEVQGFIMLAKVPAGLYRVEFHDGIARFYKPRGHKLIVAHYDECIRQFGQPGDLNRTIYRGPATEETRERWDLIQPAYQVGQVFTPNYNNLGPEYTRTITAVDNERKEYRYHSPWMPAGYPGTTERFTATNDLVKRDMLRY